MAYDKSLRIERTSSTGIVFTHEELEGLVFPDGSASTNAEAYPEQAQRALKDMAAQAQDIGHQVCGRAEIECKLECAGISLLSATSIYAGDLVARCTTPDCTDTGVMASYQSFNANMIQREPGL